MWKVLGSQILSERRTATIASWLCATAAIVVLVCSVRAVENFGLTGQAALVGRPVMLIVSVLGALLSLLPTILAQLHAAHADKQVQTK
jgi:hypothetical protein